MPVAWEITLVVDFDKGEDLAKLMAEHVQHEVRVERFRNLSKESCTGTKSVSHMTPGFALRRVRISPGAALRRRDLLNAKEHASNGDLSPIRYRSRGAPDKT